MLFPFLWLIALAWLVRRRPIIRERIVTPPPASPLPSCPAMNMSDKLTAEEALQYRPPDLGSVEPELRADTPRSAPWCSKFGNRIRDEWFENGRAVRGWVCVVEEVPDYEGPDYHIWFAYEIDGEVRTDKGVVGYDTYHWAVDEPESYAWFKRTIIAGKAITVLVDPNDVDKSTIYGLRDPYLAEDTPADSQTAMRWGAD